MGGSGDVCVVQLESVIAVSRARLRCESRLMKHGVHEVSGTVAGEGASRAIGAVRSGGETEDNHAGVGIAEAENRLAPVVAIFVSTTFFARYLLAVNHEAGTASAGDQFII